MLAFAKDITQNKPKHPEENKNNDLKEYLLNKDFVSCSQVTFKFLGISLAGYNVIVSFILFNLSVIGYKN